MFVNECDEMMCTILKLTSFTTLRNQKYMMSFDKIKETVIFYRKKHFLAILGPAIYNILFLTLSEVLQTVYDNVIKLLIDISHRKIAIRLFKTIDELSASKRKY